MHPQGQQGPCEPPRDATYRDGLRHLHRVMVDRVTTDWPRDRACAQHGPYFICEKTPTAPQTLYRRADDGSDSLILHFWSQERPDSN